MNGSKRFVPPRCTTRQRISRGWLVSSLVLVLTLLAGCIPVQPVAAPTPITLRFAISDGEGHPVIDPYVHEFADQVQALSQGKIAIELVWEARGGTFDGYEKGTLQRVLQGKYDLGLVASRTWDSLSPKPTGNALPAALSTFTPHSTRAGYPLSTGYATNARLSS